MKLGEREVREKGENGEMEEGDERRTMLLFVAKEDDRERTSVDEIRGGSRTFRGFHVRFAAANGWNGVGEIRGT